MLINQTGSQTLLGISVPTTLFARFGIFMPVEIER
jgi:hypothetical protein